MTVIIFLKVLSGSHYRIVVNVFTKYVNMYHFNVNCIKYILFCASAQGDDEQEQSEDVQSDEEHEDLGTQLFSLMEQLRQTEIKCKNLDKLRKVSQRKLENAADDKKQIEVTRFNFAF